MNNLIIANEESVVCPTPMREDATPRERVIYWHNIVKQCAGAAVEAALRAGYELRQVKAARPRGSFTGWIVDNLPNISRSTVYNYMRISEAIEAQVREEIPDADEGAIIDHALGALDGRGITDLYQDLGIVRKSSTCGGARPGAGRPRKHDLQAEAAALAADPDLANAEAMALVTALSKWAVEKDGWGCLRDEDLEASVNDLRNILDRAEQIIASRMRGGAACDSAI